MTNSLDTLKIDTPENVTFDFDVAGIGSRFVAAVVDTLLLLLVQVPLIGTLLLVGSQSSSLSSLSNEFAWAIAIVGFILFLLYWGYYIFFEILWNGQTPGKRSVGLRVIRQDGTPVTASEVVIRNLVRTLDLLPLAYGVGIVSMFLDPHSRRLGDLAAGTLVVYEGKQKLLGDPAPIPISTGAPGSDLPEGFPVERLTESELQIIGEFLQRHDRLSNRKALAQYILNSIATRLGLPEQAAAAGDPEDLLASIYRAAKGHGPGHA